MLGSAARPRRFGRLGESRAGVVLGLAAVLAVPLLVALVAVREPRWYPTLDYALTEARVRDVGGSGTPLVGLPGRLGRGLSLDEQGHHPGPLSFWALAPGYRALGSSPWALQVATGGSNAVAMGVALWLAHRRGGRTVALAVATGLAVLGHAYGPARLVEPWNPYLPLMWWMVFLLAVWSVLCDDRVALPVGVVAGCFCVQTHVSYVGLVAGLAAGTAALVAWRTWRRRQTWWPRRARRGRRDEPQAAVRPWPVRWLAASGGLLVVLWVAPLVDQMRQEPGNLRLVAATFLEADGTHVGLRSALQPWLAHLDVRGLLTGEQVTQGSTFPGLALLATWLVTVVVARRLRHPALQGLHLVVAGALAFGLLSISRIVGILFDYLVLWAWGTTVLLLLAAGWTATAARAAVRPTGGRGRVQLAYAALAAVLLGITGLQVVEAARLDPPATGQSRVFADLVPAVVARLEDGTMPGRGRDGRYLVRGSASHGLLLALEHEGFDVAVDETFPVGFARHRTMSSDDATARLTIVEGPAIDEWRLDPTAVELAYARPRPADEAAMRRFQADLARRLERSEQGDLLDQVDGNLLALMAHPDCPDDLRVRLVEMVIGPNDLARPMAVFVSPGLAAG